MKSIVILLFFALITSFTYKNKIEKNTEVTISIPQLNSIEMARYLKSEFFKYKNIVFKNCSLESKTIVLLVDEDYFSKKEIDNLLNKWGCFAESYYYRKLYDSENY